MATIKEVYNVLKQKQKNGENIGMFGESYIKMVEDQDKQKKTTKEVDVSFVKNKNEKDS